MTMQEDNAPKKSWPWLKISLLASLALNLLFVGFFGGICSSTLWRRATVRQKSGIRGFWRALHVCTDARKSSRGLSGLAAKQPGGRARSK